MKKTGKNESGVVEQDGPKINGETAESAQASNAAPENPSATISALEDKILRAKADFQNLQRRSATERAEAIRYANADLMRSLLTVADDFERSLDAAKDSDNQASIVDGVRLVYENFMKALRDHGLESVPGVGEPFDPHVHEAMLQQPSTDHPDGTVIEEITKGYRLRDRIVRPGKVIVSKNPDNESTETTNQTEEPAN